MYSFKSKLPKLLWLSLFKHLVCKPVSGIYGSIMLRDEQVSFGGLIGLRSQFPVRWRTPRWLSVSESPQCGIVREQSSSDRAEDLHSCWTDCSENRKMGVTVCGWPIRVKRRSPQLLLLMWSVDK